MPALRRNADGESESKAAPGTSLSLAWEPAEGSPAVAFFVLETCGVEGGPDHRTSTYETVVTDPPSAADSTSPRLSFTVKGLQPSTTYLCVPHLFLCLFPLLPLTVLRCAGVCVCVCVCVCVQV